MDHPLYSAHRATSDLKKSAQTADVKSAVISWQQTNDTNYSEPGYKPWCNHGRYA